MLKKLIVVASLAFTGPALAQHAHTAQKGPNGGQMEDVAGVHAELVVSGEMLTVHIFDEAGKPVDTAGYSASALLISGSDRKTTALSPAGKTLSGKDSAPVAAGTSITVLIKTATGKSGQAKFTAP